MSNKMDKDDIDFVIYHDPCPDGFAARVGVELYMREKHPNRQVVYYGTSHGLTIPDVTGRNVLICDFSYKEHIIIEMIKSAHNLLIIDHHISAKEDLKNIDARYKIFDMDRSGAALTWLYMFPNKELPLLIKHIEDRDIWTKVLPYNNEFATWFHNDVPFEYNEYVKYLDEDLLLKYINWFGVPYLKFNSRLVDDTVKHAALKFIKIVDKFHFVGVVNSTISKSDVGNKIIETNPYVNFSIAYSNGDNNNTTSVSLRSTNLHTDVSEIATLFGGGGHRNAAGIRIPYVTNMLPPPCEVLDINFLYQNLGKIEFGAIFLSGKIFNIVYMNASFCKTELCTYLLQTKYINNKGVEIENCNAIRLHKKFDRIDVHISAVYHYNSSENTTHFTFGTNKKLSMEDREIVNSTLGTNLSYLACMDRLDFFIKKN